MKKMLVDASFLVSAIRSCDVNHLKCNSFYRNHENYLWVVPTIAYFEYQATISRLVREGEKPYRDLYIPDSELYELSKLFVRKVSELDLVNLFEKLRGADLIYACIAKIEDIPLVTCDSDFDRYKKYISVINPLYEID